MIDLNRRHVIAGLGGAAMAATTSFAKPRERFFGSAGRVIGIQLYMLGEDPGKDPDGVFAKLAQIGYRDLELPSLMGRTAADLKAAADRNGARFSCIHLGPAGISGPNALNFSSSPQQIVDALGQLGVTNAVLPLPPLPDGFAPKAGEGFLAALARGLAEGGVDGWKKTAELLNRQAATLSPHGITVGYHNHDVEFAPVGGTTGWAVLIKETDPNLVQFELDLGWVAAAGLDPAAFLRRHKGRVRWVHVKDVKQNKRPNFMLSMDPTEVGSGKLDWARILPAAQAAGVRHYYVEQEPPFAMPRIEAAAKSFAYLDALRV